MSFFKRLRPSSKASFKDKPTFDDAQSNHSDNSRDSTHPSDHSNGGASTPGSSLPSSASTTSVNKTTNGFFSKPARPERPSLAPLASSKSSYQQKRRSMSNFSPSMTQAPKVSEGFYAPTVTNIESGTWVHAKLVLLRGHCGDPAKRALDGKLVVTHDKDQFPSTTWNVHDGQFKALVHLSPGPNLIRLEFFSHKLIDNRGPVSLQRRDMKINYLPMNNAPPIRLALLVASDSAYTFDAPPERQQTEGNDLSVAVKKLRMAAQLWQTYAAEKMRQARMGRRSFRFEEEFTMSTLSYHDQDAGVMRNEPIVSIVRIQNTTKEIRSMTEEQLLRASVDALRDYLRPYPEQTEYVAATLLDSHWDSATRQLTGSAAISGGDQNIKVALYGSQALHSYPSCIEEVATAFEDSTRTNTECVSNTNNTSGSNWEAANTALWGHLREVSRMLGCTEQASGIMCPRQAPRFSRTFVTNESFCTAEQRKGLKPVMEHDESGWCKLDLLRFRIHPCFRIPSDPPPAPDKEVQFWALNDRRIHLSARNGITFIEAYAEGEIVPALVRDYITQPPVVNSDGAVVQSFVPTSLQIGESDVRAVLPKGKSKGRVRLVAHSAGTARSEVADLSELFEDRKVKMPTGRNAYRSPRLGSCASAVPEKQDLILHHAIDLKKLLQHVKIYHDSNSIFGMEFLLEGMVSQLFGTRGDPGRGPVDISMFGLDTRNAEVISGFHVRVTETNIQAIRIATSLGRLSPWYGRTTSVPKTNEHALIVPAGFTIAGLSRDKTSDDGLAGFAVLVKM